MTEHLLTARVCRIPEFQDDYIYDIASRLKEVNAQHFAEPTPTSKEHKVRFADNPVDRVLNYSPTPLMDVDERLQLKKEYLMKLFAKDESERGGELRTWRDKFDLASITQNIRTYNVCLPI